MNRAEPSGRDDAFISYAREDLAFARRLHDALVARGKRVWVDLEDIPPTVDWRSEMHAGIEESKAFVFVLSPESVSSKVCMEELDHAVVLRKRLVPILYRYVASNQLRPELKAPNWISFGDAAGFDKSVDLLVEALDADYEWLDAHARYAVLAGDWERSRRDGSLLLRGSDLRQAETWLAQSAAHTETASDIQIEFILASRRAAARRRQKLFAATLIALVVSIGLGVFAFISRNDAISKQHLARSRQLAASSVARLSTDPELAIVLAREALHAHPSDQAEQALREAILASPVRLRLPRPKTSVVDAVLRPPADDRVLTLDDDGKVRLWDAVTGKLRRVVPADQVGKALFSPDGRLVATATEPQLSVPPKSNGGRTTSGEGESTSLTFRFWRSGALQRTRAQLQADSVSFLPDGRSLLVADDPRAFLADAYTGQTLWTLERTGDAIADAGLSGDGRYAVIARIDGQIRVWDLKRRTLVRAIKTRLNIASARLAPDGSLLVVTSYLKGRRPPNEGQPVLSSPPESGGEVPSGRPKAFLWRLPAGPQEAFFADRPVRAVFGPDGSKLVTIGEALDVWSLRPGATPERRFHRKLAPGKSPSVEFDPTSRYLLINATVRRLATGEIVRAGEAGSIAHFSSNGRRMAVAPGGDEGAAILDAGTREVPPPPFRQVVAIAEDGRKVATQDRGGLQIWSADDPLQPPAAVARVTSGVAQVAFGADGDVAFVDNNGGGWLWNTRTGVRPRLLSGSVDQLTFGGDGRVVAASESGGPVDVWLVRHRARGAPETSKPRIFAWGTDNSETALSGDGRYLAMWTTQRGGPRNGTVRIRDLEERDVLASLHPNVPFGRALRFSPDASALAIVAADGTAVIWNWRRTRTPLVLQSQHRAAAAAAFSAEGRFVVLAIAGRPAEALVSAEPGGIDILDAKTGEEVLFRSALRRDSVRLAEFDRTGRSVRAVLSAGFLSSEAALRTFPCEVCISLPDLERLGEQRATRELECDERNQFLNQRQRCE